MDLIGRVSYIGNRFGERKPNHGAGKSAQKDTHSDAADAMEDRADSHHASTENGARLGQKVDTTA